MSVGTASRSQVAVLGTRGRVPSTRDRTGQARPAARLITFGALALYGALKWSSLLAGGELARLLGLFLLAVVLAGGRPLLARHSRLLAAVATVIAVIAVFPLAGVPLAWVLHVRIAVTANAIGKGLTALPQVLVPYAGANRWVSVVMVLGAGVLLFDAALLLAFAPPVMQQLRRAGAALPLIALAVVPTTLLRPRLPYIEGIVLFALLGAFMWGEQIGEHRFGGALGVSVLAVVAALFLAPALDQHQPWFNYRGLAGTLRPGDLDGFEWAQGYGPVDWPRNGRVVLQISATRPEYWKAENLDVFDGVGWAEATVDDLTPLPNPDASAVRKWTEPIQVTIREMTTLQVIGAGITNPIYDIPQGAAPGVSPGTFVTPTPLEPGESYRTSVYAPDPSPAQLNAAGSDDSVPADYLTVELPPTAGTPSPDNNVLVGSKPVSGNQPTLVFPPFHSRGAIRALYGPRNANGATLLRDSVYGARSPYGDAYGLARQLAAGAATPYQFAEAVKGYLDNHYTYNESPPRSSYPLESFLFLSRKGYCQQFAGAMALLLRMGGVPARVAVGFTSGRPAATGNDWIVTDYDAHAWVEVWFPHYGWVKFEATPAADPAISGHTPIVTSGLSNAAASSLGISASKTGHGTTTAKRHAAPNRGRGSGHRAGAGASVLPWIGGVIGAALLGFLLIATKPISSEDALVQELDGALRKIGRPLPPGATLTWLEHRVGQSPDAAAYVRGLRLARFGGGAGLPTRAQRRALRRQLRLGLGLRGALRAVWALPPRRRPARTRARGGSGA